jgi:hypothetical protein
MKDLRLYRLSAGDVLLIGVVLAAAASGFVAFAGRRGEERVAWTYHGARLVEAHPLNRDGELRITDNGARVIVEFRSGRVRVAESSCPNQVCVRMGWISRPGQTIVCVPNRVMVAIRGGNAGYDAETR